VNVVSEPVPINWAWLNTDVEVTGVALPNVNFFLAASQRRTAPSASADVSTSSKYLRFTSPPPCEPAPETSLLATCLNSAVAFLIAANSALTFAEIPESSSC